MNVGQRKSQMKWIRSKTSTKLGQYPGTTTGPKLYESLERKQVVVISWLRAGHCHLNQYLYRFNIIETPECECGAEREAIEQYH